MTQQPYAQPVPQQVQQPYPGQPQQYVQPAQQPYAPQFPAQQAYPPQQMQQPYGQVPHVGQQVPQQPLAQGSLDDFFNQPGASTGPAISWSSNGQQKPIGTSYVGIVARDVTQADIQQETDPNTNAPKFFKDGRPKFVMKVPLKLQPSQEFPEGEATYYVRGQSRDELVRAMTEAGASSNVPRGGDALQITLVQRRPSRMGNPANIVQITYTVGAQHGGGQAPVQQQAQPVQQPAVQPAVQPVVQPAVQQQVQQPAQQVQPHAEAPSPAPEAAYQPVQQQGPQQVQQSVQQAQQPVQQPVAGGLDPEQQALLARLTGGAPQA